MDRDMYKKIKRLRIKLDKTIEEKRNKFKRSSKIKRQN